MTARPRYVSSSSKLSEAEARAAFKLPASTPRGDGTTPNTAIHPILAARIKVLDSVLERLSIIQPEIELACQQGKESRLAQEFRELCADLNDAAMAVELACVGGVK